VVFERKLPRSAVRAAAVLAAEYGISIVAYDGDAIYTTNVTKLVVHLSKFYGEPTVDLLIDERSSRAMELADHGPGLHKLILMDEDLETLAMVRLRLEELAETHNATVTQALPTMLELLPAGCSKAYGVARVCEALGVNPAVELLALGDAENDSGMLRMASIGVAVGNACPQAREAADFVMRERHDEGGAGLAMNLFGF
jgi:hydroxymethylpyrimidine pyrophosphatase-like HAD family hydrolase